MGAPKQAKIQWALIICGIVIIFGVQIYRLTKHTFPVQIIRGIVTGKPGAQIWADDLADDVRSKSRLKPLQDWSVQTLARYRAGQLSTKMDYGSAQISSQEVPDWLVGAWGSDRPKVFVSLTESNMPECIDVRWYLSGLLIGPTNYVTTFQPWYIVQVKPGIYAYSVEK